MIRGNLIFQGLLVLLAVIFMAHLSVAKWDKDHIPERCLKAKPIQGNYKARGKEYKIWGLPVYESPVTKPKRLLIAVYDIFGLSNNMKQVVDSIAEIYGFRVVMPDFLRGHWWNEDNFPPKNEDDLESFISNNGSWEKVVRRDIKDLLYYFRKHEGVTEVGIFGMCWGGMIANLAASEIPEIKAAGLVHPSGVENEDAKGVKAPMFLIPSQDEDDMSPFYKVLQQKFGDNCGHRRFDDMPHGFAAARGNFSDPLNAQRVDQVVDILGLFFTRNMPYSRCGSPSKSCNKHCSKRCDA